jgi:hypothetical protein
MSIKQSSLCKFGVFTVRFGSVLSKKIIKPNLKKPKPVQTDRFRFGSVRFLEQKPVQTGLARFFRFGSVLAWFGLVFLVWLDFGSVFWFGSVLFRFGSV